MKKSQEKQQAKAQNGFLKALNLIAYGLFVLIMLAAVAVSYIAIRSKAEGTTPSIGSYQILKVVSGSMEPAIHTGSVIVIKEIDPAELKVGDIVTFRSAEYDSQLVTHRIVRIDESSPSGLVFTTKGDANDTPDINPLPAALVAGRQLFSIPLLGYVMDFMQSRKGTLLLIILPCLALAIYEIKQIGLNIRGIKQTKAAEIADVPEE